jgi:hypothetical protein
VVVFDNLPGGTPSLVFDPADADALEQRPGPQEIPQLRQPITPRLGWIWPHLPRLIPFVSSFAATITNRRSKQS